jgi:hypothetical protein
LTLVLGAVGGREGFETVGAQREGDQGAGFDQALDGKDPAEKVAGFNGLCVWEHWITFGLVYWNY